MEANKAAYDKEVKAHRLTMGRLEMALGEVDELKEELAEARAQFKVFHKVKEEAEREEAEAERAEKAARWAAKEEEEEEGDVCEGCGQHEWDECKPDCSYQAKRRASIEADEDEDEEA